jgi:hypothetical protein
MNDETAIARPSKSQSGRRNTLYVLFCIDLALPGPGYAGKNGGVPNAGEALLYRPHEVCHSFILFARYCIPQRLFAML